MLSHHLMAIFHECLNGTAASQQHGLLTTKQKLGTDLEGFSVGKMLSIKMVNRLGNIEAEKIEVLPGCSSWQMLP